MILCGLDVGGSGTKCSVFGDDGRCIAFSRCEYNMMLDGGKYEINAEVIWNSVKEVLTEVAAKTGGTIDAIAISALGEAGVPLSSDDRILAPSILFHDPRGRKEAAVLKSSLGNKRIYEKVGSVANGSFTVEKLAWIKNNEKYYDKIKKFFPMEAFIIYMLSGEVGLSYSSAARTLAFDIRKKCWDREIIDILGLDSELLPPVFQSGTIIGNMKKNLPMN